MTKIWSKRLGENLKGRVHKLCVSPNGKHILVSIKNNHDQNLYILDISEHKKPILLKNVYSNTNHFVYGHDGSYIVSEDIDEFNVTINELDESKTKVKTITPLDMLRDDIVYIAVSPDGKYIAAANSDNEIGIWDIKLHEQLGDLFENHKDEIKSVSFSSNSKLIVSVSADKKCLIWDIHSKKILYTLSDTPFTALTVSLKGNALAWGDQNYIKLLTFKTLDHLDGGLHEYNLKENEYYIKTISFSPNGKLLVSGSDDNTICIWNVDTLDKFAVVKNNGNIDSIVFNPDSKSFVSSGSDGIRYWYINSRGRPPSYFDTVKGKKQKPFDIIELIEKSPSLNANNKFDMFFQIDKSSISIASSDLDTVMSNTSNVKYECKKHVKYTALHIGNNDYVDEPYLSIRTMGFTRDGLIPLKDIKKAMERYNSYYYSVTRGGNNATTTNKTTTKTRRKRCPNGSRRDKKTGKCKDNFGNILYSVTNTATKTKRNTLFKSRKKLSPLKYTRNFNHALVFSLQETSKIVERIVSKQVIIVGNVISADHCQSDLNYKVYKLVEVLNKSRNRTALTA